MGKHSRIIDRAMTRLKLRQLRLLVAVDQQGSIQAAARELHLSQPAATKMIRDLETDFEVLLFERTNRGVVPTEHGRALIRQGKIILAQISNVAQELDDLTEGSSGRVVVGTLLAASADLLPRAIELLLAERPKVAIKIVEGTNTVLVPALLAGEIDMIVGRLPTHRLAAGLEQETLLDERIVAIVGSRHPLAGRPSLRFDDLKPFGWILPPPETSLRLQVDQFFTTQEHYAPPCVLESLSYLTNRSLLAARDLIGLVPEHAVTQDTGNGMLTALRWVVPFGHGPVGISHRGAKHLSPAGNAFLEALRRAARSLLAAT